MSDSTALPNACPKCGAALPAETAEGLCPRCLMAEAMLPTGPKKAWEPPTAAELGELLPEYEIEKLLGRGGMGAVYKGRQKSLDRAVAIKILSATLDESDQGFAERFKNEARALGKLKHPGIVGVYDFGTAADGLLYIVMEFIDGTDVAKMIAQKGRLHTDHAMAITAHVCDALAYAHERGIIHRDIKPANIMVGYDGVVQVADFGLAKMTHSGESGLTQSGMAMGTMHYMAPEALTLGTSVDHRADIYAVGVMLYQMLTGKLPQGLFNMPSLQIKGLDPRYDGIIGRALMEDRDARYQTITEMRMGLDEILTQPVVKAEAGADKPPAALNTQARPKRSEAKNEPLVVPHHDEHAGKRSFNWQWAVLIVLLALGAWEYLRKRPAVTLPSDDLVNAGTPAVTPPTVAAVPAVASAPVASVFPTTMPPAPSIPTGPISTKIERTAGADMPADLNSVVPAKQPLPDLFLGDLKPVTVKMEWTHGPNQYFNHAEHRSKVLRIDGKEVGRYWLAHTPSLLEFAIPLGYTQFKATGFAPFDTQTNKPMLGDWIYRVEVDDKVVFESKELRTYPNYQVQIEVPLSAGAKKLVLKTISNGGDQNGHSLWGYPTLVSDNSSAAANSSGASTSPPAPSPNQNESFTNTLGMKFVPVPGTKVLFCIHETRRQDYAAYAKEVPSVNGEWKEASHKGVACGDKDGHPVVSVNWDDAKSYCAWLSKKEGKTYRLPTDREWSMAIGIGQDETWAATTTPASVVKNTTQFPWGVQWPPPKGAGNYMDVSWNTQPAQDDTKYLGNYADGFPTTAPVMSFKPNALGLYDMGGNLWEWCEDWYDGANNQTRVLRGASWADTATWGGYDGALLGSFRCRHTPNIRYPFNGFRVVLEVAANAAQAPAPASTPETLGDPPNTTRRVIDLLPLVDLPRDASNGAWSKTPEGINLAKAPDSGPRIQFPHSIATEEYDYEIEISYANTGMEHRMGFPVFGRRIDWAMNIFAGSETPTYFFVDLDGRPATQAKEAVVRLPQLKQDSRHHTVIKVRNGELAAFFDGKQVVRWKGDTKRFNPSPRNVRDPQFPDLFFYWGGIHIHKATVTEFVPKPASPPAPPVAPVTKEQPFTNTLGMKFVPVPETNVLMCIHETRRKDFASFAEDQSFAGTKWKSMSRSGVPVGHEDDHPVVGVSWVDAKAFCDWLGRKEGHLYRLPTDSEWSFAVGIADLEKQFPTKSPLEFNDKVPERFPWGGLWPPPAGAGNFADESLRKAGIHTFNGHILGYNDGYPTTAPVMSFAPNGLGIYDLAGNVTEWCEDWVDEAQTRKVHRGRSWDNCERDLLRSSWRSIPFHTPAPDECGEYLGFRCVLEVGSLKTQTGVPNPQMTSPTPSTASLLEQQYQAAVAKQVTPVVEAYAKTLLTSYRSALERAAKNAAASKSDIAAIEQEIQRLDTQDSVPDDDTGASATTTKLRTIYRDALKKFQEEKTAPLKAVYEKQQAAAQKPSSVSSSFTAHAEGWTVFESNGSTNLVKDDSKGYLPYMDYGPGSDYFFAAPPPFIEAAHRASPNATLSFDLHISASDNATYDAVILESPTLTLVLPKPNPPVNRWTTFKYRFHPAEGWKVGTLGRDSRGIRDATAAEIEQALHTATRLLIRGEWSSISGDTAWLDNVRLEP